MSIQTLGASFLLALTSSTLAQPAGILTDTSGTPIVAANIKWVEANVTTQSDAQGKFAFTTAIAVRSPRFESRKVTWLVTAERGTYHTRYPWRNSLGQIKNEKGANLFFALDASSREKKNVSPILTARQQTDTSVVKATLDCSASGFLSRRIALPAQGNLKVTLLPSTATLRDRLHQLLGDSLTFRVAWLQPDLEGVTSLYSSAWAEANGGNLKVNSYTNSKGATLPAFSPDGQFLAYETGKEAATVPTSRIYLQPFTGTRLLGPAFPATNPRFAVQGNDTALIWCTSGKGSAYNDLISFTLKQNFKAGNLSNLPDTLAQGSYNAGLSTDGRYLAAGYPQGILLDLKSKTRVALHAYPNSKGGVDTLQVCNLSISKDPAHSDRALFIDFGVFAPPGYANLVRPATYAQHQMLLLADFNTSAGGHIVDYIDTPPEERALGKTWEDPEWSTHPDFAVATTRLDDGNEITQPDIYLIKLSTHETVKLISGSSLYMPVLWVGKK